MNDEVKLPYELKFSQDALTGLRSATLIINSGFPKQYLGEYVLKEWNYGEKLKVELEAENIRAIKLMGIQNKLADNPSDSKLKTEKERLEKQDVEALIVLQTLTTIRKSPTKLETIEDYNALPGRLGTLLTNIAGYLNISPDEEKKS